MAKLRAFKTNNGNVYELFNHKREKQLKEERILELEKRNLDKKTISKTSNEVIDKIPLLVDGRKIGLNTIIKSLTGA